LDDEIGRDGDGLQTIPSHARNPGDQVTAHLMRPSCAWRNSSIMTGTFIVLAAWNGMILLAIHVPLARASSPTLREAIELLVQSDT
jgi:hypothetical protein